jgi:hypothetical protein
VTDARVAVLTNGVVYDFYSDVDKPNKMDEKPFFSFNLENQKPHDLKTLESFRKNSFDVSKIIQEAGNLKIQNLLRKEIEKEFSSPSDEFIRLLASRVHQGNVTQAVKERFSKLVANSLTMFVRDLVNERLASAINASNANGAVEEATDDVPTPEEIITTQEELSGFHIVQAISSRVVDPKRVVMRDQQSYCGVLLDDTNRKPIVRMHFNGLTKKYVGTFKGKDETKHLISEVTQIYQLEPLILDRLKELAGQKE